MSKRLERELLTTAFGTVRNRYFPRWDKARLWKCRVNHQMRGDGLCCQDRKIIYINTKAENLIGVVIHEICHAVRPGLNHGGGWQRRMLIAASRAERLREPLLADFLRSEVTLYRDVAETVTARSINKDIEQIVAESPEIPAFESIVGSLAPKNLMSRKTFLGRFRGSKKAYQQAVALRQACEAASGALD